MKPRLSACPTRIAARPWSQQSCWPAASRRRATALLEHLAARLVRYKLPREIRVVAELPKTSIGKVDKARLRDEVLRAER